MKIEAIMQPYFLPYIGYWQLLHAVDEFVVYDNIEYTKKGWYNRNRILENGRDRMFTVPIKKDSDYLSVDERYLSDDSELQNARTQRVIAANYRKAPHFQQAFPVIESCFQCPDKNLFRFIFNSIQTVCQYLDIDTPIIVSSEVHIDHEALKAEQKVLAVCKAQGANRYINTVGGTALYDKAAFAQAGVELQFIKAKLKEYPQFGNPFVPGLSIVDVMMFNDRETVRGMLDEYELL